MDNSKRVVITGIGIVTPIGKGKDENFKNLKNKVCGIIKEDGFYVGKVNINNENKNLELARLTLKEVTKEINSLKDIGFIFSCSKPDLSFNEDNFFKFFTSNIAYKLSEEFNITGLVKNYNAACATGLVSIIEGARLIKEGRFKTVIAGAVEASINPMVLNCFKNMGVLTQNGIRPFDISRDGMAIGEGCGVVVMEDLESAIKRDAEIYCEIVDFGLGSDAYHITSFRSGENISKVITKTLKRATLSPGDIDYINAHGTGTIQNDEVEVDAYIKTGFTNITLISSTKSYTGHLLGAAGAVEVVFSALSIFKDFVPANLKLENPLTNDLFFPSQPVEKKINFAISLSFGFGGHIGCIILGKIKKRP